MSLADGTDTKSCVKGSAGMQNGKINSPYRANCSHTSSQRLHGISHSSRFSRATLCPVAEDIHIKVARGGKQHRRWRARAAR
mmetsp:Transcript_24976/g.59186  ORF Transcript_24976/g.59186 Transcript_24976/m.59186 type:complete len:82 (-) Transcript_24976:77-322(-)